MCKTPNSKNHTSGMHSHQTKRKSTRKHNFTFVKSDKGSTTVITSTDNQHNQVQNFMRQNNITELKHDHIDKYQNTIKQVINKAKCIITNKQKSYLNKSAQQPLLSKHFPKSIKKKFQSIPSSVTRMLQYTNLLNI